MTNFEKYREEILKITKKGDQFAVLKKAQVPIACTRLSCVDCLFGGYCQPKKIRWLYKEAVEPAPTLTVKERGFCEIIRSGYIARDQNGSLWLFDMMSAKEDDDDITWWNSANGRCEQLNGKAFPFITWESDKAWSIEELLRLEVEE